MEYRSQKKEHGVYLMEYITKAQAIALAESLRHIAGNGITDAFIKGIDGLEPKHCIMFFDPSKGGTRDLKGSVWYRPPKEEHR